MLKFHNIRKSFGPTVAVDGLNLEIETGEVFGLLGPNGAGKTTTVNMAVGVLEPDAGTIELKDAGMPSQKEVRAKIGVAPQTLAIYEELSGRENLAFYGKLHRLHGRQLKERIDRALDFVTLMDRADDRASKYSGGMKRRLNLAIALIHDPPVLLLDEPTVGVDPQSRNSIFEKILQLKQAGKTIVYTTHYMEEAERLCERVGIMDNGKLLALETVDNLIAQFGGESTLIVKKNGQEIRISTDDPFRELVNLQNDGELDSFRVERPNLEGVFLNLTGRQLRD